MSHQGSAREIGTGKKKLNEGKWSKFKKNTNNEKRFVDVEIGL